MVFSYRIGLLINTLTNASHTNALLHAKTKATGAAKKHEHTHSHMSD